MTEGWKVLLIDDDAGIRRVTAMALEDAGYTVLTAPDGETGIKVCQEQSPQIVITDIGMPGIDGLEVLRRIKEMDPDKEVIVATAFTEIALAIKALQLDASGFVTKPVGDDSLAFALKRARERYAKRKELRDYTALMEEKWMDTAEELARTFLFQKMLIESSMDGIVACDPQGKIIIFNHSMEKMLGYSRDSVVGKMSLERLFPPEEFIRLQEQLLAEESGGDNRLFPFDTALVDRDGRRIVVLLSATVLFHETARIGLVVFVRDLQPTRSQGSD
jgi:two-component system NtrC family sensor kinase